MTLAVTNPATPVFLSLILPVHNGEKWIEGAIGSVLSQSEATLGVDYELIIVNDGSTDSTMSAICGIIEKLDGTVDDAGIKELNGVKGIKVKELHKQGVSVARNTGISIAEGEFITFLDADDLVSPQLVRNTREVLGKHPFIDILSFDVEKAEEPGEYFGKSFGTRGYAYPSAQRAVEEILYQTALTDCSPWGKVYRRELFDSVKFTPGIRFEDLDIFYRLYLDSGRKITAFHLYSTLYFYRSNPKSFLGSWNASRLDVLDVCDQLVKRMESADKRLQRAAAERKFSANYNILAIALANPGLISPETEARCIANVKKLRFGTLFNDQTRLKSKIGALLSLFGKKTMKFSSSRIKKYRQHL